MSLIYVICNVFRKSRYLSFMATISIGSANLEHQRFSKLFSPKKILMMMMGNAEKFSENLVEIQSPH